MKHFSFLALFSSLACAADFNTGQAARLIIGQPTFTAQSTGIPSAFQLGAVGGVAYANNTIFIVDGNRVQATPIQNRLLIYNNISGFVRDPSQDIMQGQRCPVCAGSSAVRQADAVVGQPDFVSTTNGLSASNFRTPTSVASDGQILAVTDTDNNRVLIWKTIPTVNGQPADIVLGQTDFKTVRQPPVVDNKSFRGPQGVWVQGTRLFVADTQNHRVMVWNTIPSSNNQPADYVLGQPNFSSAPQQNIALGTSDAKPDNLLNPVSVTSDGRRLFVTDLGHHRILIWSVIPTQTQQAADFAVGQPDLTSAFANNTPATCTSTGTDPTTNKPTYPARCGSTLSFPRFALSDGTRLYVADGGNDRVLVYNKVPTASGARADAILGQVDEFADVTTDSNDTFRPDANITRSSADTIRTPSSLAWDGANLYASDPYDRRVLIYTPADVPLPLNAITNAFSRAVFAVGTVDLAGTIKEGDTVTITVGGTAYTYTVLKTDTLASIVVALVAQINKLKDTNVFAIANPGFNEVVLSSKVGGVNGNLITLAASTSTSAVVTVTVSGSSLGRGQSAAEVAPGTLVSIFGTNLSDTNAIGQPDSNGQYPTTLGGVTVYFDGIKGPLLSVSDKQINTQVPFGVQDTYGVSSYVVTKHRDGTVTATTAVNVPIVAANPGILAGDGQDPRPAFAIHTNSFSTAVVDVSGTSKANDTGTITINGTSYVYTVQSSDTPSIIRDALIGLINADPTSPVTASAAGQYTRIILTAKVVGPDGNGITVTTAGSTGAQLALTALQAATCCASTAGSQVTVDNPAVPGEIISIFATGIGLVQSAPGQNSVADTGIVYNGTAQNSPTQPVDDAQLGGTTANVLNAGLKPGLLGVYEVQLQISPSLPTNDQTQLFIAQNVFTSNIVTIPVRAPAAP